MEKLSLMKIKKIAVVLIIILISINLSACQNKKSTTAKVEQTEYYLNYDNIAIKLNSNYTNIIATLGLSNDSRKENENTKVYSYDNFEIETSIENNVEKIKSLWFTSENITTNEGLKIGDTKEKIEQTYGQATTSQNDVYIYSTNGTSLSFVTENNKIINIEYMLT